jgi:hypothetical protein
MDTKHNDWKVLQLFTTAVVAAIVSSALSNATLVQAATTSEPTTEERLVRVREYLKQREGELRYPSHTVFSPQDNPKTGNSDTVLGQWSDWSDWPNWPNSNY